MTRMISAIKVQKKNQQRVNIYLDGEFAFGLSRITAAWLNVGQCLREADIARLQAEDEVEVAYQRALHFLSYRLRSVAEVRKKLNELEFPEMIVDLVCARLQEKGYVDDQRFAEVWVENRNLSKPRSYRALRMELRQKKVDEEIIGNVLENTQPEENLARLAGENYARRLAHEEKEIFYRRLSSYLGRRGFSFSIIQPLVHNLWKENHVVEDKNLNMEEEVNYGE